MKCVQRVISLVLVLLLIGSTMISSDKTSVKAVTTNRPVMDSDYAALFIGFITNSSKLSESQIKNSDAYKILTNTYEGEYEEAKTLALKLFIEMSTAQMANQAEKNKAYYEEEIVYYLEKNVPLDSSIGLAEEIINEQKNTYANMLVDELKNIVDTFFPSSSGIFQVGDLFGAYSTVTDSVAKAHEIVNYTMAVICGVGLIFETEYAGRYGYFQSYLTHRSWGSPDDEAFCVLMNYNKVAYTDGYWMAGLLDAFTFITNKDSFLHHFDLLDYWAEFTYLLGESLTDENIDISTNYEVESVGFIVDSFSLFRNYTATIPAVAYPTNAQNSTITYVSSDNSVATVDSSGKVVPVGIGSVTIYASTANGAEDSCQIDILPFYATEKGEGYEITDYVGNEINVSIPSQAQQKDIVSIGDDAFYKCDGIKSIVIPKTVTYIGEHAFNSCTSLTSINIPYGVTSLKTGAFRSCKSLTEIIIPESVTSIGEMAFQYCYNLEDIIIPEGVTKIYDSAFNSCEKLLSIDLSSTVEYIGDFVFVGCNKLQNITVNSDNKTYDSRNNCNAIIHTASNTVICGGSNAFIDDSITSIGERAFYNRDELESIIIPDSVTSVGDYAFGFCDNLTKVVVGKNVTDFGDNVFYYCIKLADVTLSNGIGDLGQGMFYYCESLKQIDIPESVSNISDNAFNHCSNLEKIDLHNAILTIGDHAFERCEKIGKIDLSNNLKSIGNDAFLYCTGITEIKIPDSVETLGSRVFSYCKNLESVSIGSGVDSIQYSSFFACVNLSEVELGGNIKEIEDSAFFYCRSLTNISIPYGVTTISSNAFAYCTSLFNIVIPNTVTNISGNAFAENICLRNVYYTGSEADWSNIDIINNSSYTCDIKNSANMHFGYKGQCQLDSYCLGDVNLDGVVSIMDATFIQLHLVEQQEFSRLEDLVSDVDNDNAVSICDATKLQRCLAAIANEDISNISISIPPNSQLDREYYYLYFSDYDNWGSVSTYYWSDDNKKMLSWPGVCAERIDYTSNYPYSRYNIYKAKIPVEAGYVIFNNNSKQTPDLVINCSGMLFDRNGELS